MEITKVKFGRVISNGNYGNDRYSLTAKVSPEDNVFEVFEQLSELIELSHQTPKLSLELSRLEEKQKTAQAEVRKLKKEEEELKQEVKALQKEKAKLRELFAAFLEGSIPAEDSPKSETANEAAEEGGDPDDIPY